MKWFIKKNHHIQAQERFSELLNVVQYWCHFSLSLQELVDVYVIYMKAQNNMKESIKYGLYSKELSETMFGVTSLATVEKNYQLSEIYYDFALLNTAFMRYSETKSLLELYDKTDIPEYTNIMLRLAIICTQRGNFKESKSYILDGLKSCELQEKNQKGVVVSPEEF